MIAIEHSLRVNTLLLTWQSNQDRNKRFLVGTLRKIESNFELSYLYGTSDFENAIEQGFVGYPAFPLYKGAFTNDVMATFMKRLPPRSRRDFKQYLKNHNLPETFDGTDFELISHTGIRLPSDGFDLIPNLEEAKVPFEYVMEVAGTRHNTTFEKVSSIEIGALVQIGCEDDNEFDCNAIVMKVEGEKIGYMNRLFCSTMRNLLSRDVRCTVAKISGTPERPLIYVLLSVK